MAISSLGIESEELLLRRLSLKTKNNIVILNTSRLGSLKYGDHIFLVKRNNIPEVSKQIYFAGFPLMFEEFSGDYNTGVF